MTKKIVAIWAEDENRLIGVNDGLPWRLPEELKHFKETTMGQALLMGRVTFDGMNRRILPGRKTLILTRSKSFETDDVAVVHDMDEVFDWFEKQDKTLYIVGGASIYRVFLPHYDAIIKTAVHGVFEGDTYFPDVDSASFRKVPETFNEKDDKNTYDFTITVLEE